MEVAGVGITTRVENTQLIEKSRRTKRSRIRKGGQPKRIWSADLQVRLGKSVIKICVQNFRFASHGVNRSLAQSSLIFPPTPLTLLLGATVRQAVEER
jgi:hypothetical protein